MNNSVVDCLIISSMVSVQDSVMSTRKIAHWNIMIFAIILKFSKFTKKLQKTKSVWKFCFLWKWNVICTFIYSTVYHWMHCWVFIRPLYCLLLGHFPGCKVLICHMIYLVFMYDDYFKLLHQVCYWYASLLFYIISDNIKNLM